MAGTGAAESPGFGIGAIWTSVNTSFSIQNDNLLYRLLTAIRCLPNTVPIFSSIVSKPGDVMPNAGAKTTKFGPPNGGKGRPVSCYFCRQRKLRCSRALPCSNCVTRGVKCSLFNAHDDNPTGISVSPATTQSSLFVEVRSADASLLSDILERLNRLENLVSIDTALLQNADPSRVRQHGRDIQPNGSSSPANPVQQPQSPIDQHLTADVRRLEQVSTSHPSNVSFWLIMAQGRKAMIH